MTRKANPPQGYPLTAPTYNGFHLHFPKLRDKQADFSAYRQEFQHADCTNARSIVDWLQVHMYLLNLQALTWFGLYFQCRI